MTEERFVVRLRGLPWSASDAEIIEFVDCQVIGGGKGIKRTYTRAGRPGGEAYIELSSQEDVIKCLDKDRAQMGKRYIEVFKSSGKEMDLILSRSGDENPEPTRGGGGDFFMRLRGLPYQCSKEEISQFFAGLEIVPNGITMILDDSGRCSGEAYVEFASASGSEGALQKHKEKIGHRYIEIFKSTRREMMAATGEYDRPLSFRGRPGPYDRPRRGMRGGRFMGRGSSNGRGGYGGFGGGDYYDEYQEDEDYSWNDGGYRNGVSRMRGRGRGGMKGFGNRGMMGGGGYGGFGGGMYDDDDDGYYNDMGPSKIQVVHMRGLPFKATDKDINSFFAPLLPLRIHRAYGKDGRIGGEADVEFASYKDAQTAMLKDGDSMMHRYIELFLRGGNRKGGRGGMRRGGSRF